MLAHIIPIPSLSEKQTHQLLDFYIFIILYIYIPFKYHFSISHELKPMLCHDLRKLRRRTAAGPPASQLLADLERLHALAATHQLGASERPSLSAGPGMDAAGHTTWWRHGNLKLRGKTTCEKRMLIGCEVKYSGFGWILVTSGRLWGFEPIFGKLMVFDGSCRETTTWWERFGWELTENWLQTESALLTNNPTTISRNFPPKKHYPILRRKTMVN